MSRIERPSQENLHPADGRHSSPRPLVSRNRREQAAKRRALKHMQRLVNNVAPHCQSLLAGIGWNPAEEDEKVKTLAFTSSSPGMGVSTLAAQTAMTAALKMNARTLLVDGHVHSPTVHRTFRTSLNPGLSHALRDNLAVLTSIHETANDQLFVMPAGDDEEAWHECSHAFSSLLKSVAADFQLVVVDMPAVGQNPGVFNWVSHLDVVLLVIASGAQSQPQAQSAARALKAHGARRMGAVLNRFRPDLVDRLYRRS